MADVTIRVLNDGPYEVKGPVDLLDSNRNAFAPSEKAVYLCRCGQSANRPFCDGMHKKISFQSKEPAR